MLQRSPLRDLKEGVAYVWTTPRMRAAIWIAFLANLTAFPLSNGLLPYIAREIYGTNQTGLGYLSASFRDRLAGWLDPLEPDRRHPRRPADDRRRPSMWYATLLVFAQIQSVPAAIACLMLAGFSQSITMISIAVILMRTASEHFRGRVMGVRMLAIYSLPLGLLAAGSLIERDRLCRYRHAVRGRRVDADAGHRAALARRPLALARAGECEIGMDFGAGDTRSPNRNAAARLGTVPAPDRFPSEWRLLSVWLNI